MKKLLLSGSITALLLPGLAFAAYNDVSLITGTVLSVNGINVNVSGSEATIESIEVGDTSFAVTLASGSSFYVSAPGLNVLSADTNVGLTATLCDGSSSALSYTATGALTVTITPSTTLCASAGGGSSPSSSSSSSSNSSSSSGSPSSSTSTNATTTPIVAIPAIPMTKAEAIVAIKTQLIALIQQLITLLAQELQTMQASGGY